MVVERTCIKNLEIFLNSEDNTTKDSFFSEFECVTTGGKRLLRSNLLQPMIDKAAIIARQDAVQKLM